MKNLIAVSALVMLAFVAAAAQDAPKPDKFTLQGATKVKLSKLIERASADNGIAIEMDGKWDAEVAIAAPRDGVSYSGDSLMMLVQEALEGQRLALAPRGDGYVAVNLAELDKHAPALSEAELATLKPWQWARLTIELKGDHAHALTGALRNFVARQGGMVKPDGANKLVICERGDRMQRIHALAMRLDSESVSESEAILLPMHLDPEDVVLVLHNLFATRPGVHFSVEADPDRNAVIVKATPALRAEIKQTIELLK